VSAGAYFHAGGFYQSQCEQAVAYQHGQRLPAAGASLDHLHRLTWQKTQFGQALQGCFVHLGMADQQAFHLGAGSVGHLGQQHGSLDKVGKQDGLVSAWLNASMSHLQPLSLILIQLPGDSLASIYSGFA
jgi:hypothetical protein